MTGIFTNTYLLENIYSCNPHLPTLLNLSSITKAAHNAVIGHSYFRLRILIAHIFHRAMNEADSLHSIRSDMIETAKTLPHSGLETLIEKAHRAYLQQIVSDHIPENERETIGNLTAEGITNSLYHSNNSDALEALGKYWEPINFNTAFQCIGMITDVEYYVKVVIRLLERQAKANPTKALGFVLGYFPRNEHLGMILARHDIKAGLKFAKSYLRYRKGNIDHYNEVISQTAHLALFEDENLCITILMKHVTYKRDAVFHRFVSSHFDHTDAALKIASGIKDIQLRSEAIKMIALDCVEKKRFMHAFKLSGECQSKDKVDILIELIINDPAESENILSAITDPLAYSLALALREVYEKNNFLEFVKILVKIPNAEIVSTHLIHELLRLGKDFPEKIAEAANLIKDDSIQALIKALLAFHYPLERCREAMICMGELPLMGAKHNLIFDYLLKIAEQDVSLALECMKLAPDVCNDKFLREFILQLAKTNRTAAIQIAANPHRSRDFNLSCLLHSHKYDPVLFKQILNLMTDKDFLNRTVLNYSTDVSDIDPLSLLQEHYIGLTAKEKDTFYLRSIPKVVKSNIKRALEYTYSMTEPYVNLLSLIGSSCTGENLPNVDDFRAITALLNRPIAATVNPNPTPPSPKPEE